MRIEIFVVKSKIDASKASKDREDNALALNAQSRLDNVRNDIIKEFGGLTAVSNAKGFWINDCGSCETDNTEIWLVYVNLSKWDIFRIQKRRITNKIKAFNQRIKEITAQESQAYGIDGKLIFL